MMCTTSHTTQAGKPVNAMPRMYATAQDERFPGCRSFWVDPAYRVYYMVAAAGPGVYVAAIIEEEVEEIA